MMMRAVLLTLSSFLLTSAVIGNAFYQKKQFYPSVVYLTKSNPCMAVIYLQAFVLVVIMGKLMRKIFFGQLRAAEMEHLMERFWYAITETCLAFTVFRDDFSVRFVGMFTILLFLKCFHWLAEDRIDFMERSPVISPLFHLRAVSLLSALISADLAFIAHAYYSTLLKGASVQLVFGFEYAILLTVAFTIVVKYILHTIDLHSATPWEGKAVYVLYTELVTNFIRVCLYSTFFIIMIKIHTFPLFAIRPMYLASRAFKKAVHDVIMSRKAIRNLNTLYPNATADEIRSNDVCIICREEMDTGAKKLPCTHIFHAACLRSWFQRQQTCPTCRMDVLRTSPTATVPSPPAAAAGPRSAPAAAAAPASAVPAQQAQQAAAAGAPGVAVAPGVGVVPPSFPPMWPPQMAPTMPMAFPQVIPPVAISDAAATAAGTSASSSTVSSGAGDSATTAAAGPRPVASNVALPSLAATMLPPSYVGMQNPGLLPMPGTPGFGVPFPQPPPNLSALSTEELEQMEGRERANLEARIQCLRNIQTLLDAAVIQMQQYSEIIQRVAPAQSTEEAHQQQQAGTAATSEAAEPQTTPTFNLGDDEPAENVEAEQAEVPETSTVTDDQQLTPNDCMATTDTTSDSIENGHLSNLRKRRLAKLEGQSKDRLDDKDAASTE